MFFLGRKFSERRVERNLALFRVLLEIALAVLEARALPGPHRAFAQRLCFVGHYQPEVDADHPPEAAAHLAGTEGRVERERRRRGFGVMDVAVGAVQIRGKTKSGLLTP